LQLYDEPGTGDPTTVGMAPCDDVVNSDTVRQGTDDLDCIGLL
jgi:hypothetical protein